MIDVRPYLRHGYTVIPCKPREKVPAVPWQTYQSRKPTQDELAQWFGNDSQNNLAVVTGQASGVVVLDVDGPEGATSLQGKELPPTPVVKTARGRHYYFKWPGYPVRNFARKLPGLDLRGDGGIVVAPPSIHPDGSRYTWEISPNDLPLADLPGWLVQLLDRRRPAPRSPEGQGMIVEGGRNQFMATWAGAMRRVGMDEPAIRAALLVENKIKFHPPLPKDEVAGVAKSISRYRPEEISRLLHVPLKPPAPAPSLADYAWTLAELLAAEFPPPIWVAEGLLPVGLCILAGRPKVRKSWLALQLAVAVSTGGTFFDRPVEQRQVLFFGLEDSDRRLQDRLVKMGAQSTQALNILFTLPSLSEPQNMEAFWEYVAKTESQLVIIDTLTRAFGGAVDWDNVATVTDILSELQSEAQVRNICILGIDHHKKSAGNAKNVVDDILGSTGKSAVADSLWGLYRSPGKQEFTLDVTGRDIEEQELAIEFDYTRFHWNCLGDADGVREDTVEMEVVNAIVALGGEATATEVAEYVEKDLSQTRRVMTRLVAKGALRREPKRGREVPYSLIRTVDNEE